MAPTPNTSTATIKKGKGKGKTGGTGKKGKVFLEDKSDLLSLISSVTSSKDAISKARITKTRSNLSGSGSAVDTQGDGGVRSLVQSQSSKEKNPKSNAELNKIKKAKELNQAKAVLLAKEREKRQRKAQAKSKPTTADADEAAKPKTKKRVGFA